MSKRILTALIAAISTLTLVACGSTAGETTSRESNASVSSSAPAESAPESSQQPSEEASQESPSASESEYYFKDNVLLIEDVKITITDYKVVDAGAEGNEYGDKPVIVFYYDTTNLTGAEDINASVSWIFAFEVVQDNDPNTVNSLEMGMYTDPEIDTDGFAAIKEGGTVSYYASYELDDLTTPVSLIASNTLGLDTLGEQTYEIAQ